MAHRENWMSSMPGRSCNWPRPMLERLIELDRQGLNAREITSELQGEFNGLPQYIGETVAELKMLKTGPKANQWNPAMEARLQGYYQQGMDVNDITNELFNEFAKPQSGFWQEVYRKIQDMKLKGRL